MFLVGRRDGRVVVVAGVGGGRCVGSLLPDVERSQRQDAQKEEHATRSFQQTRP